MEFPCTGCGACCRQLPPGSALNRGDGACRHHDEATRRCIVYAQRPLICQVDELYRQRLAVLLPRRVYYMLQAQACVSLDPANAAMPREMARRLVMEEGEAVPSRDLTARIEAMAILPPEEAAQGMRQVMAVVRPML